MQWSRFFLQWPRVKSRVDWQMIKLVAKMEASCDTIRASSGAEVHGPNRGSVLWISGGRLSR